MKRRRYGSLRQFMAQTRTSQADLAGRLGVTPSAVSYYVAGLRIPKPAVALKLSRITGVPLETLLTRRAA